MPALVKVILRALWGFQSLIFISAVTWGPTYEVRSKKAIDEEKVPEKQEQALGRKRVI